MYTTVLRQYVVNWQLQTYCETYEGDEKTGQLLATAKLKTEVPNYNEKSIHWHRMAAAQQVCQEIAQNLDSTLF